MFWLPTSPHNVLVICLDNILILYSYERLYIVGLISYRKQSCMWVAISNFPNCILLQKYFRQIFIK